MRASGLSTRETAAIGAAASPGAELAAMRLAVFSHKQCWRSTSSSSGYATDGGFPMQMGAISELFASTTLVVPRVEQRNASGEVALTGRNLRVAPLAPVPGRGLARRLMFPFWLLRNMPRMSREVLRADAIHAPIPGDVGTVGMVLATLLRKPLFVRHCGNWDRPVTRAEHFWRWFMERFGGGRNVMLATGGADRPPSARQPAIRWIFSTSLTEAELERRGRERELSPAPSMIIVCRQEQPKGTGVVIEALRRLADAVDGITLVVVGDGADLEAFERLAAELGVADRVTFTGKLDHDGVMARLEAADIFCYPTGASEGFPKVVLEALASGLPVVTTPVSVLPTLLRDGGGIVVERPDPELIADAVLDCLGDAARYRALSSSARRVARAFSLERWRDEIGDSLSAAWSGGRQ